MTPGDIPLTSLASSGGALPLRFGETSANVSKSALTPLDAKITELLYVHRYLDGRVGRVGSDMTRSFSLFLSLSLSLSLSVLAL